VDFAVIDSPTDLASSEDRDTARRFLGAARGTGFDDDRARILELVDTHEDIAVRTCRPGHLTGSAFVVDPSRDAGLLLFHTKLQKWLQPGGHADGDTNLAAVALKEATEETGIEGLRVVGPAIDVDIHRVDPPAEDAHLHLDVRFLVLAPPGSEPVGNHESQGFRWLEADELAAGDYEAGLKRMAATAFPLARQLA
jgi:8-oxo-dGTP pyrophosphatase MutT (NUDIX family)